MPFFRPYSLTPPEWNQESLVLVCHLGAKASLCINPTPEALPAFGSADF